MGSKKKIELNDEIKPERHVLKPIRIFFLSILLIVAVSYLYVSFFDNSGESVSYSPSTSILSTENAKELVMALGPEGVDWYCGRADNYVDSKGNTYGAKELAELKRILGSTEVLEKEICS